MAQLERIGRVATRVRCEGADEVSREGTDMSKPTITDRILRGETAMRAFAAADAYPADEPQDLLTDLLTDLRHWAGDCDLDFEKSYARSESHYAAECE